MSCEETAGKVLPLSDAESDGDDDLKVGDMAAALPATEHYTPLDFPEKRRADIKTIFDFACENGKLDAKQVRRSCLHMCLFRVNPNSKLHPQAEAQGAVWSSGGRYTPRTGCCRLLLTPLAFPRQTHKIMFTKDERAEYGFSAFEEDLFATCPHCKDDDLMAWGDVLKFLDENL